jgi:hypothetical protein
MANYCASTGAENAAATAFKTKTVPGARPWVWFNY